MAKIVFLDSILQWHNWKIHFCMGLHAYLPISSWCDEVLNCHISYNEVHKMHVCSYNKIWWYIHPITCQIGQGTEVKTQKGVSSWDWQLSNECCYINQFSFWHGYYVHMQLKQKNYKKDCTKQVSHNKKQLSLCGHSTTDLLTTFTVQRRFCLWGWKICQVNNPVTNFIVQRRLYPCN